MSGTTNIPASLRAAEIQCIWIVRDLMRCQRASGGAQCTLRRAAKRKGAATRAKSRWLLLLEEAGVVNLI